MIARWWFRSSGVAIVVALAVAEARGDERQGDSARLRPLQEIVERTTMVTITPSGRARVEPLAIPIYNYDDPARKYVNGAIWAWKQSDRPIALMVLTTMREADGSFSRKCEMTSLAPVPLLATIEPDWVWGPARPGLDLRALPKSQVPAGDAVRRLRQIKKLARRFRAFERFAPTKQAAVERYELRLLPQPVLRYSAPASGLLDGAIFFLSYGRNPEVALLIQATRDGVSEPIWTYALARMGRAELHVQLDDQEVWIQPSISTPSIDATYTGYNRRNVAAD